MYICCVVAFEEETFYRPHVTNVTDTISWQGHLNRVMQLNWLYFCGIYQTLLLKVWPNTALGCSCQSIFMPQLQHLCSAGLVSMYYPREMKASISSVQSIKLHRILAWDLKQRPLGTHFGVVTTILPMHTDVLFHFWIGCSITWHHLTLIPTLNF